jgi:hypothetical protein
MARGHAFLDHALTAAADALDLRVQQPVAFRRRRLDVIVIGMTPIASRPAAMDRAVSRLMDPLAAVKTAAKSMTAAGFGRRPQDKAQAYRQHERLRRIADRACHIAFSGFVTPQTIARLRVESRRPDFTISRVFGRETSLILRKVVLGRNV